MNNQIMLLDVQGRRYEFYPTFNKEECYNLMHYLFQFPFALLDLNIYKHHTEISSEHLDQETKFDIQTAQEALDTAEDMRKIKLDSYQMLESQQRKIAMIDQLLNQTDVYLGEIEESIKATTSLVYELKLRYTKKKGKTCTTTRNTNSSTTNNSKSTSKS
ncbi:hypothetical protein CL6EHI_104510B [Entamoeba histolytica]|uniref:Uncharacterized protein n=1 Tax=Entamoeba histolytica TaxID=5759 RepID=A0A175JKH8_ENTHI|nr:hypothetical protein CL6EHI_104510B [Entamoeba histolytica]